MGLSVSGKRLRVENVSASRPGGVLAGDGELGIDEKDTEQGGEQGKLQAQPATMANPPLNDTKSRVGQDGEVSKRVEA